MDQGDALLIFTDGLMEGFSQAFQDPSTVLAGVRGCADAKSIGEYVLNQVNPEDPLEDDLTLVVIRRQPSGQESSY